MPAVSIIMGIYNCEATLEEAVNSILIQSYDDWELIMCDDCSTDSTYELAENIISRYPHKMLLLRNLENRGLNYTLNKCLRYAKGEFIARMDGDDLCDKYRLEKEVNILNSNTEFDIVSTDMSYFDENGEWGLISHPEYPMPKDFLKGSPFCHAASLIRKSALLAVGGYTEASHLLRVEDYHLWIKMYANGSKGKNIHETLYKMRDDRNAYSRRKFIYRINEAYIKGLIVKKFKLSPIYYVYVLRPIIVGLMPEALYNYMHRSKLKKEI